MGKGYFEHNNSDIDFRKWLDGFEVLELVSFSKYISIVYISLILQPQPPEVNEQLEITDPVTNTPGNDTIKEIEDNTIVIKSNEKANNNHTEVNFSIRIYKLITEPIYKILKAPKVNLVLRNIGTCLVNGAMELFTFYLPPPMLPLVASAAGLVIPFEPVVMLKEKMPVTSYRRAFKTAMNTFLSTFDQFKMNEEDEYDPYMTRRFNRRFMDDDTKKKP